MAATDKSAPVLDLDTLVERYHITVNGQGRYELRNNHELSLMDLHKLSHHGARVEELMGQVQDLSEDQALDLSRLLDIMCRTVLIAPDEIHERLTDRHKLAVVQAFNGLQRGMQPHPAGAEAAAAPSTGASTSPA